MTTTLFAALNVLDGAHCTCNRVRKNVMHRYEQVDLPSNKAVTSDAWHKRRQRSWRGDRTNQTNFGPTDGRMHPSTGIAYTDKSLCNG